MPGICTLSLEEMKVLFLCTGNSARSILAQAIARHLGHEAYSAGSQPSGQVNPRAFELLQREGISTQALRSKAWDKFQEVEFDQVITLCDHAARESCPVWQGSPRLLHWGLKDPASDPEPEEAFANTYRMLEQRIRREL